MAEAMAMEQEGFITCEIRGCGTRVEVAQDLESGGQWSPTEVRCPGCGAVYRSKFPEPGYELIKKPAN